jgi:hypothetical protein
MTIQRFVGPRELENHYKQRIKDARFALSKLPLLNQLVDNFSRIEYSEEPENVVFWKCAWAQREQGKFPDVQSLMEVTQLESFLKLGAGHWKLDSLADKLRDNDFAHSLGGFSELVVLGSLATKFGPTSVEFEPKLTSGKKADIRVRFENRTLYVEVTALSKREPERKLDTIFLRVAKAVWFELDIGLWVHLEIDTQNLIFEDNMIAVDSSVERIVEFLKRTNLKLIFVDKFRLNFWFTMAGLDPKRSLYDQRSMLQNHLYELYDRIEDEPFRTFAKSATPGLFVNCPLSYFWCIPSKRRLVEVADREVSPSPIAAVVRKAFFSQIDRTLEEKLNQLEPGAINMVVLRATDWSVPGYEKGKLLADYEFDALNNHVEEFLLTRCPKHLSAVALYEEDFHKSQFVLNPAASTSSQVTLPFLEGLVR